MASASIYSIAGEDPARTEAAAWARFTAAQDSSEFCASWLAILCAQVDHVSAALLLLAGGQAGAYGAAAVWPDPTRNVQYLGVVAQRALTERRGVVVAATDGGGAVPATHVAYPIEVDEVLYGAVVLDVPPCSDGEMQRVLRLVHWGTGWLIEQFRRERLRERELHVQQLVLASDLVATALQEPRLNASALSVANELASRMQCERVSVGMERHGSVELCALSHNASFDRKSKLVGLLQDAMDEVLDLEVALSYPQEDEDEFGAVAHAALAREMQDGAIYSVPLVEEGHAVGVLTLERSGDTSFTTHERELVRTAGLLLGPILSLQRQNDRNLWQRSADAVGSGARALFGPRHPGVKLVALLAVGLLAFLALAKGEYRVSARTVIEGAVQRAAVAPFDGYIAESRVRAGDTVSKGEILASLDKRDLRLEQARWKGELDQLESQRRQAQAAADRASMMVLGAQISQTEAQLALVDEKLSRASLLAPFDGVVVSGDLSQLLGTPVETGKVLFEIAPLQAYRVILQVDERDISNLAVGQSGALALAGMPGAELPFSLRQITPVTTASDGRNYFRVEATIDGAAPGLRPGMEGVGKVAIGERRLLWIWAHSLVDWARLWVWNWMP